MKDEDAINQFKPDHKGFVEFDDCLIHKDAIEMYLLFTMGKVPENMSAPIIEREDFGSKIKNESKFLKQI